MKVVTHLQPADDQTTFYCQLGGVYWSIEEAIEEFAEKLKVDTQYVTAIVVSPAKLGTRKSCPGRPGNFLGKATSIMCFSSK